MKIIKIFFLPVFILSCHLRESDKLICSSEEYDIARLSNSYIFDGHDEPEIKIILDKISDSKIKFTNATVDKLSDIKVEFSDQVEDETLKKNLDDKKTTDEEREKILKKIQENSKKQEITLKLCSLKNSVNTFNIRAISANGKKYYIYFEIHRDVQLLNYQYGLFLTYFVKDIKVNIPKCNISKNIVNRKLNRSDNEIEIQY